MLGALVVVIVSALVGARVGDIADVLRALCGRRSGYYVCFERGLVLVLVDVWPALLLARLLA